MKRRKRVFGVSIRLAYFLYAILFLLGAAGLSLTTVLVFDHFFPSLSFHVLNDPGDVKEINEDTDDYMDIQVDWKQPEEEMPHTFLMYNGNWFVLLLILLYFTLSVHFAAALFFRRKLFKPLAELNTAAKKIAQEDLDFEITYSGKDEMGELCASVEHMRRQLQVNNQRLWDMFDEQKRVQRVFSHDIRTPLTVTKGYVDLLQTYLPYGELNQEKTMEIMEKIQRNLEKLENFVNTMSSLQRLDELHSDPKPTSAEDLFAFLKESLSMICWDKIFLFESETDTETILIDRDLLEGITANLVSNAASYAKTKVELHLAVREHQLTVTVHDDGKGFSPGALERAADIYYSERASGDALHFGIGFTVCKALCEKCGGNMQYYNDHGAVVCVEIPV